MPSAAVIVGIDNYKNNPLSSAVNDALAFQRALLDLKLVEAGNITLITAPAGGAEDMATRKKITDALLKFYREPNLYDLLYFFFAGHGISAFDDRGQVVMHPVLLAQDVVDLVYDGSAMIDLDELRDYLRSFGPQQQLFFIDACRDLKYDEYPNVSNLGWGRKRDDIPAANNCQATLFAVAPLGSAAAARGGQGVMTGYLLEALRSDRLAVQYDDERDAWTISMGSLAEYVREKVETLLQDQPLWKKTYNLPQLDAPDPKPSPLRVLSQLGPTPLTVHIRPDEAAKHTQVKVILRGEVLEANSLPPRQNHEALPLRPQRYRFEISSVSGTPKPGSSTVDVRRQQEFSIFVAPPMRGITRELAPAEPPSIAFPFVQVKAGNPAATTGKIWARAVEPQVTVEVESLEGAHQIFTQPFDLQVDVPPGPYQVRFRLGKQIFCQGELYLMRGQEIEVHPTISGSALLNEALNIKGQGRQTVTISESLGPIQAGVLDTVLPIIGIKPFDLKDKYFEQFTDLVEKAPPNPAGSPWLSVVVAVDDNQWTKPVTQVLASVKCTVVDPSGTTADRPLVMKTLKRSSLGGGVSEAGEGFKRVRVGLLPLGPDPFRLAVNSPHTGNFELAGGTINRRATVITITLHPDGSVNISQALLRYPGRDELYDDELNPHIPPGRANREIQLGQKLYQSGELFKNPPHGLLEAVAYAKWTDPVLSCMGFYAWMVNPKNLRESFVREIARNLNRFFGNLPDSRVIYGQVFDKERKQIYLDLISENHLPILAESARILARFAEENGNPNAAVVQAVRRIPAGEIWTVILKG